MINSERLFYRPVLEEDLNENYVRWLNDRNVSQYLETKYKVQTLETVRIYWEENHNQDDSPWFAICKKEGSKHIGNIKLGPINWIHRKAEISLFIGDQEEWGKNFATEAIATITSWAFNILNLEKINAYVYETNIASRKAFIKSGYQEEGLLLKDAFLDGSRVNVSILGKARL